MMFRGAFNAIRDRVRKLFNPPVQPKNRVETKPTPAARPKKVKENVSRHQWAQGHTVRYSDRSYYVDDQGRFLRLHPGETVEERMTRLAGA
jgi:hypothetical protein